MSSHRKARNASPQGRRKPRRGLRIAAWSTAAVVVVGGAGAGYEWMQLNANIKSSALHASGDGMNLTEKADPFGHTPVNILVMGSDSRSTAADCKLGGACAGGKGGERADVEMVVHLSADRSNATVMSIPRDLMTPLPHCAGGKTYMINSALSTSEGCQVDAVEKLTNIPIDHFVKVDFQGVVAVSQAIGGVPVCVSGDVYDTNSHLKLTHGQHTLLGTPALEFLRTRDAFTDGSDTGRTGSQHMFLASAVQQMKSAGTVANPVKALALANAITSSITVDPALKGITKLADLAQDLNKVPSNRITFTTMPYVYGTGQLKGRVLAAANAPTLFRTIADDVPLTAADGSRTGAGGASASASAKPAASASASAVAVSSIAVRVENGQGGGEGHGGKVLAQLTAKGFSRSSTATNGPAAAHTTLTYPAAQTAAAKAVATALGLPATTLQPSPTAQHFTLLIGADWPSGPVYPGGAASAAPSPVSTVQALAGQKHQTAADKNCAQVGNYENIPVGYDMQQTSAGQQLLARRQMFCRWTASLKNCFTTPAHAYALFPKVKDSDA